MLQNRLIRKKSERGQSFLELGISLLFLLTLLCAVIDLGWAYYTMIALRDTSQEAAAFGTMCPDKAMIKQRLQLSATAPLRMGDIPEANITITFLDGTTKAEITNAKKGDIVKVAVWINHQILIPLVGTFIGTDSYPLKVDSADTIMVNNCPPSIKP